MHLKKNGVLLKLAEQEDVPFILGAAQKMHENFDDIEFDKETTLDTINAFLESDLDQSMLVVAFVDDKYVGVVAGMLSLAPFSTQKIAVEPLFWTNGNHNAFKLLHEAFSTWASKAGADVTMLSAPPSRKFDKWQKFYDKLGYKTYEHTFIKEN